MLVGAIVALSLGFLVCQIIDAIRDAWRRREFRRAVEVIRARDLRLLGPQVIIEPLDGMKFEFEIVPPKPVADRRGEFPAVKLEFPDRPIIPNRDAHFGE